MQQDKKSLVTKMKVLEIAGLLFAQKGFESTTMQDIINNSGVSKGAIYHHFKSKEEILEALNDKMFCDNNPFNVVKNRKDLTGLQKMKMAMALNQADKERAEVSKQAIPILKNPRILASMIETNRRLLSPFWLELIEEGNKDGSIQTQYARELSELIPLLDFWLTPSVYPASVEQMQHKFLFIKEMLDRMGLPLIDDEIMDTMFNCLAEMGNTL